MYQIAQDLSTLVRWELALFFIYKQPYQLDFIKKKRLDHGTYPLVSPLLF
jgi:hypothetical protein